MPTKQELATEFLHEIENHGERADTYSGNQEDRAQVRQGIAATYRVAAPRNDLPIPNGARGAVLRQRLRCCRGGVVVNRVR
jgi:hypothetical protein